MASSHTDDVSIIYKNGGGGSGLVTRDHYTGLTELRPAFLSVGQAWLHFQR